MSMQMQTPIQQSQPAQPATTMYEPTPQDAKRRDAIRRAWAAYRGEFKKPLATPENAPDDNVITNRCVGVVDTGVDWLSSKPFTVDVLPKGMKLKPGVNPLEKPPQFQAYQNYVEDLFGDGDDMMTLFSEFAQNAGIAGHTFLQIVWNAETMDMPRLVLLDPSNIYVTSDPDDVNTPLCYTIETIAQLALVTQGGQPQTISKRRVILRLDPDGNACNGMLNDTDDTWQITDYMRRGNTGAWQQTGQTLTWPYPFPPIIDAMNLVNPNEYWGLPDLTENVIGLNQALIFNRSNTMRINKNHAMPWGLIAGAGGDMKRLEIRPGSLLSVPQGSTLLMPAVYGDIAGSKVFADDLMGDIDEQTRVPAIAFGRQQNLPKGNLPGVTAELLYLPLSGKTAMKRRLLGRAWRNLCLWCLALKFGVGVLNTVRIELHWPSMLPSDDLAAAQSAQLIEGMAIVSKHTLAARFDYDYDREEELMAEEAAQAQKRSEELAPPAPPVQPEQTQPSADGEQQPPQTIAPPAQPPAQQTQALNHPAMQRARAIAQRATKG